MSAVYKQHCPYSFIASCEKIDRIYRISQDSTQCAKS
jgi:hypothetical protein